MPEKTDFKKAAAFIAGVVTVLGAAVGGLYGMSLLAAHDMRLDLRQVKSDLKLAIENASDADMQSPLPKEIFSEKGNRGYTWAVDIRKTDPETLSQASGQICSRDSIKLAAADPMPNGNLMGNVIFSKEASEPIDVYFCKRNGKIYSVPSPDNGQRLKLS